VKLCASCDVEIFRYKTRLCDECRRSRKRKRKRLEKAVARARNPEKFAAAKAAQRKNSILRQRRDDPIAYQLKNKNRKLREKYGITLAQRAQLIIDQDNRCKVCEISFDDIKPQNAHIDHDHATRVVRGILCSNCNLGIGNFRDSIKSLERAIIYIRESR